MRRDGSPDGFRPTPRHVLCAATPHKVRGTTPTQYLKLPSKLSMWLNNVDGDCVTAEEAFNQACGGVLIADQTVKTWAQGHGVLNGADLSQVLGWMAQKGFSQDGNLYNVGPAASVNYGDYPTLCNAIAQGPVKLGVAAGQLQNSVGNGNGWFATGYRSDNNEDHCTDAPGFGPVGWLLQQLGGTLPSGQDPNEPALAFFTWSTVGVMTYKSLMAICGEAWLRTPNTLQVGTGTPTPDTVQVFPAPTPPNPNPNPLPTPGYDIIGSCTTSQVYPAGSVLPFPLYADAPIGGYDLVLLPSRK